MYLRFRRKNAKVLDNIEISNMLEVLDCVNTGDCIELIVRDAKSGRMLRYNPKNNIFYNPVKYDKVQKNPMAFKHVKTSKIVLV